LQKSSKTIDRGASPRDTRQKPGAGRTAGLLISIVALYVLLEYFGVLNRLAPTQLAESAIGYAVLFVLGLVTSVHCIAMCGGINLSQCIPEKANGSTAEPDRFSVLQPALLRPAILYNSGRVISYTAVGFIVGALGSVISFSATTQGVLKLVAGTVMVIMGINMLGIFPWLRKLGPRMPKAPAHDLDNGTTSNRAPLFVGLLNGLMPCGSLQAMQIYALSTGSPLTGALSMLLFSLGTVPLMFGLGAISLTLGKRFSRRIVAVGAVLVVVLGLSMLSQGSSLSGLLPPFGGGTGITATGGAANNGTANNSVRNIQIIDGKQLVKSTLSRNQYPNITVQAGTPVKWVISASQENINGCNSRVLIQEYRIEHSFAPGENVIEFTPTKAGKFPYSCWMGMIKATITVTEENSG